MARVRRIYYLSCPSCGNNGQANVSDNDEAEFLKYGRQREVDSVSNGFIVVDPDESVFHCGECGGVADMSLSSPS